MNKTKAIAWVGGVVLAATTTVVVTAASTKSDEEGQQAYRSSIQVDRKIEQESELVKLARISAEDASRIASSSTGGKVAEVQLENEGGNLIYSVELPGAAGTIEVIVDAGDGRILSTSTETEGQDESEDGEQDGGGEDRDK